MYQVLHLKKVILSLYLQNSSKFSLYNEVLIRQFLFLQVFLLLSVTAQLCLLRFWQLHTLREFCITKTMHLIRFPVTKSILYVFQEFENLFKKVIRC